MIERKFVAEKLREKQVEDYIATQIPKSAYSYIELKKTPLGEKVIIYSSKPGLIVGVKGENVQRLTRTLKKRFMMENPQVEIGEIENPLLDANSVAERIAAVFERFGTKRFKFLGHDMLTKILEAGAKGAEIVMSGKLPSARARSWRFYAGHLKKSGDISENYVQKAVTVAKLQSGIVGIKVKIMHSSVKLPDEINIKEPKADIPAVQIEAVEETKSNNVKQKKTPKKKAVKEAKKEKTEDGNNKEEGIQANE